MKLTLKTFLLFLILIPFGWVAFNLFEIDSIAKTDSQKLDRLFREMGVIKVTPVTGPVEIRLKDLNGKQVNLSELRGKIVFLNFWTTWCPTCIIEMPSMQKLHQMFKDKDFAVVAINLQESASQVKTFFKELKLTFTALLDTSGDVGAEFGIRSIPTTFILDKNGSIIGKVMGPREWDSKDAIALFTFLTESYVASSNLRSTP